MGDFARLDRIDMMAYQIPGRKAGFSGMRRENARMQLGAEDPWVRRGYGQASIEPGTRPAVLVIDFQRGFIDADAPFGGSPLIQRAVENTVPLLATARDTGIPVLHTVLGWESDLDLALWTIKIPRLAEITPESPWAQVDARLWDERDLLLPKKWPSMFNGTPLHSILTASGRDTVIITGCTTSGCVRATTVDSFSSGFRTLIAEDCVGDMGQEAHDSNLRDIHRRYAEVTTSSEVASYLTSLENVPVGIA
jgi:maleamate amidohydrolase